jgi:spermidine synthase
VNVSAILYVIIFLEGYVVLATELLAIRQLIPFVGSGTETIAIIIAAVLMPLAFGYYAGGKYKAKRTRNGMVTIRKKLLYNIVNSSIILAIGLSYIFLELFFTALNQVGITHRVLQAAVFSGLFLVYPVYLLGQTVPLISNYFRRAHISRATGIILCCSTVGSFVGATLSTLVLMGTIGVHNIIIVNIALLCLVAAILEKRLFSMNNVIMAIILLGSFTLNGTWAMEQLNIIEDNNYNTISIKKDKESGDKIMVINRSLAAKYSEKQSNRFPYIKFAEVFYLNPIKTGDKKKSILVIGAGGFVFGQDDNFNDYTYVDIDKTIKTVAEKHFFGKELGANKKFAPIPAEVFILQAKEKYDLIFLDAYTNNRSIPSQLITQEFFGQVKNHLTDKGIMLFNVIANPVFNDRFSIKIDNTLRKVFSNINRNIIGDYDGWNESADRNILYVYYNKKLSDGIYTNDKNTYYMDR